MISSKDNQLVPPIYAPKRVKDLIQFPAEGFNKLKVKKESSRSGELLLSIKRIITEGLVGDIGRQRIHRVLDAVKKIFLEEKKLTKEAKYLINLLLAISVNGNFFLLNKNKECLLEILKLFKKDDKDFDWFYKKVASYLTESQFTKLQEAYSGSDSKNTKNNFKGKQKIAARIISLFNDRNESQIPVLIKDSTSFLGLDNSAMEAVCWKELELSRSGSDDFARLAGTIAWRNWLFKEPLLKEFCLKNGYGYDSLSFIQKAKLTKEAVSHFAAKESARILNKATETELNRRKKTLEIETNPKFIDKRVSLGIELEMSGLSFELAIIYAWYENLDRSLVGDSVAFNNEIEKLFKQLLHIKDQKKAIDKLEPNSQKIVQIIEKFRDDLTAEEQADLKKQVLPIIAELPDRNLRRQFKLWLKDNPLTSEVLDLIQKLWKNKRDAAAMSYSESRETFRSFLTKPIQGRNEYYTQSINGRDLPIDYPDVAKKLIDIFKHHMGQAQALGHEIGGDAYGEYSLAYTSGNFKDPYRVNLRETWELAKTSFHNLDVDERPMHVTIGWKEDMDKRRILIPERLATKESSLMNFAMLSTGWANRNFIDKFKEKNEKKLAEVGKTAAINSYMDSGKGELVKNRRNENEKVWGIEFRGFSPTPGLDQARLFSSLGSLGTAMKAYMVVESDSLAGVKLDAVDRKLHEIWQRFSNEVKAIHNKYGFFPDLFNAKAWQTVSYSEPLTNFYLKMAEDLDKDEGLVADMRKLVQGTTKQIDEVFSQVPDEVPEKKRKNILAGLLAKVGFKK